MPLSVYCDGLFILSSLKIVLVVQKSIAKFCMQHKGKTMQSALQELHRTSVAEPKSASKALRIIGLQNTTSRRTK